MKTNQHIWKLLFFDMFVIEFGPVGVFFVVYYLLDFPRAALGLAVATLAALLLSHVVNKRVPWFALFSGSVTMVTSLATYILTAPSVLIVKDSLYYFLFAGMLAVSLWRRFGLFQAFFGHIFAITETGWRILETRWLVFFVAAGVLNELVRIFLSVSEWVVYKQIVVLGFLIFGLYQFRVSSTHRLSSADKLGLNRGSSRT